MNEWMNEQTSAWKSKHSVGKLEKIVDDGWVEGGGGRDEWCVGGKKKKKIQKENRVEGTFKEEEGGKQKEMVKQIFKQICVCVCGGAKIRMEVGGGEF